MNSTIFRNITSCSPLKVNWSFGGTYHLHLHSRISRARYQRESAQRFHSVPQWGNGNWGPLFHFSPASYIIQNFSPLLGLTPAFTLVSGSTYSTLKMEAICFSERSVYFRRTTRHYIPEDKTLHGHRCENIKSYIIYIYMSTLQIWRRCETLRLYPTKSTSTKSSLKFYSDR
jgi:hypothetical protein